MKAEQIYNTNDLVKSGRWDVLKLIDALLAAPQARRPIRELAIAVLQDGVEKIKRLAPEQVEDDPDWPSQSVQLPSSLIQDAKLATSKEWIGTLTLHKAGRTLTGRLRDHNSIWVLDPNGNPVGFYPIRGGLPIPGHSPLLEFFHGELQLTFERLNNLVMNDRDKLAPSRTTDAILEWVGDQIWERVHSIEEAQRAHARRTELELATGLNDELNKHAKRFLEALQTEMLVDLIEDEEGGGLGPVGGDGTRAGGKGSGGEGTGGLHEVPGTTEHVRRPRFPQVLLSGIDADPATGGTSSKFLTDRHPPLDQDDDDKKYNVWWINTEHPFANAVIKAPGGAKGAAFKSYQLHMFRDVVQREALRLRQRREMELSLDRVENELSDISDKFLGELPRDLIEELLG